MRKLVRRVKPDLPRIDVRLRRGAGVACVAPYDQSPYGRRMHPTWSGRAPLRSWIGIVVFAGVACRPAPAEGPQPADVAPAATEPSPSPDSTRAMPEGTPGPGLAFGTHGAVASAEAQASEAGLAVLRDGGNAVDAAIAVGLALAVTHPSAGNLGGGGFMVIAMADERTAAIDYREAAPSRATSDMYLDAQGNLTDERLIGPKAAGIPGTVAGFALAHEKFGRLPWARLVEPAARLALEGSILDSWHVDDLTDGASRMQAAGFAASATIYRKPDGTAWQEGDRWVQPELGATLRHLAEAGPRGFYEGPLAQALVRGVVEAGGIWQEQDLASYVAKARDPLVFTYRGHQVVTMPPPSAGGVVLRQLLAASEIMHIEAHAWRSLQEVHLFVEAARRTYADRNLLLGDPDFVELPMDRLLDTSYVAERMADVDPNRATPSSQVGAGLPPGKSESHQTTHFSVVDAEGNAVSNTYTLNLGFGARFVVPGTGVLLNNEMDDFATKPGSANVFGLVQGEPNKIEPGKRMLSSMTPTILLRDGELRAVVGSPGGPTITTTVAQIVRALVDYALPLEQAVESVRVHHQWLPDMIWTEDRIDAQLEQGLERLGHAIRKRPGIGHANCIEVDPKTRGFRAVADISRDGGRAVAY